MCFGFFSTVGEYIIEFQTGVRKADLIVSGALKIGEFYVRQSMEQLISPKDVFVSQFLFSARIS